MDKIELKYNRKKIILYMIFTIIMIAFFWFLFSNSYELSLRKPANGKYSWVGHMVYNNDKILSTGSMLFMLLFCYVLIRLVRLLIRKKN
ncbi:hypothetical protein C8C84_2464 [Flavobacterium sp. 102]|nr:hypothetical protein C8C84_2464 [Flavobacterium sp. 102]